MRAGTTTLLLTVVLLLAGCFPVIVEIPVGGPKPIYTYKTQCPVVSRSQLRGGEKGDIVIPFSRPSNKYESYWLGMTRDRKLDRQYNGMYRSGARRYAHRIYFPRDIRHVMQYRIRSWCMILPGDQMVFRYNSTRQVSYRYGNNNVPYELWYQYIGKLVD